jgi:DNA-binding transcriptional LysR family regulator
VQAAKLSGGSAGATVHLGGPADMLASRALPALAPIVGAGVRLRVRPGIAEDLLALLAADEIDLVIATRRIETPGVTFQTLFHERLVLIGNPAWAARLPADVIDRDADAALASVPLVAFDEDLPLLRPYWEIAFGHTLEATAALTVADLYAVCSAVAAGAGISVVPRYLAVAAIARGELVELHAPRRAIANPIHLAYRRPALMRPGVDDVRTILATTAPGWEPPSHPRH